MKCVVLFVITSVGFVLSFPGKHQYPAIENVYGSTDSEEVNEDVTRNRIFKKSISAYPNYAENDVNPEGTLQEPCRVTLPTLDLTAIEIPQDPSSDVEGLEYLPEEVKPPNIPRIPYNIPFNSWTPYDLDYLTQAYNSYNMPYYNMQLPNPVPSVRSLPPVISTHILETIPEVPQIDDGNNMNDLSESDVYFPPFVRAVRSDDFQDQLEKDAVIPNILPTMPFPYMRSAGLAKYQSPGESGTVALFPSGSGSDCAIPFLVSCSPKIYPGTFTQNVYGGNTIQSALANYRARPSYVKSR